jgi:hypothetical protein
MFLDKERSVGMLDLFLFSYPDSLFHLHVFHFVVPQMDRGKEVICK